MIFFMCIFWLFMYILSSVSPDNWNYTGIIFLVCSHVYWLGDLNYRITELDPWLVKDYIDKGNYLPLLEYDQLHQQHGLKNVFAGYQEGNITFRPTYKYDPGSDNWDSRYCNSTLTWFCYTVKVSKEVFLWKIYWWPTILEHNCMKSHNLL